MQIRQATLADAEIVGRLICDVQQLHADALPHLFKPADDPALFVADCRERILVNPDGWVFVVEDDGEAIGYVYAHVSERPENAYTYARRMIHIDQISVKPDYQGGGYGRALINAVFDLARREGVERVTLGTLGFNTQAQGFFRKMGFDVFTYQMDVYLKEEL
ncbi:MAG: GNAT family N-acetyltransferase [Anaerolineaceae bacterium]|nr:GNAT family N-acetyltransferase [Anaerolineaceae bacterium]